MELIKNDTFKKSGLSAGLTHWAATVNVLILFTALAFRPMNNNSFNTCFVIISPPVNTNAIYKSATHSRNKPEKEWRDTFGNKIEQRKKDAYVAEIKSHRFE
jgi:hypothetical protein